MFFVVYVCVSIITCDFVKSVCVTRYSASVCIYIIHIYSQFISIFQP